MMRNVVNTVAKEKYCKNSVCNGGECTAIFLYNKNTFYRISFPKRKYHILHNTCFTNTKFYDYEKETHDGGSAARCVDIGRLRGRQ